MTKTYEDCCKEVGLDITKIEPPNQVKNWYAYVDGKVIKCENQTEAKKYKLYEVVLDTESKLEIINFWDHRRELEESALIIFKDSIRADYSWMSDGMFNLCYLGAQEWGRSTDYDEIPDTIKYFVEFSGKAIKLKR